MCRPLMSSIGHRGCVCTELACVRYHNNKGAWSTALAWVLRSGGQQVQLGNFEDLSVIGDWKTNLRCTSHSSLPKS